MSGETTATTETTATETTQAGATETGQTETTTTAATTETTATTETGKTEGATTEGEQKTAEPPAEYADFVMPEGVEVDAEAAAGLRDLAKELKLTQDQAQKFADLGGKMASAQLAKHAATIEQWGKDAAMDKEFGGEKLQENLAIAKGAMLKLAPGLAPVLESTGLGNHPEFIRAFWKAGLMMADDKVVAPGSNASGNAGKTLAQILYPGSN